VSRRRLQQHLKTGNAPASAQAATGGGQAVALGNRPALGSPGAVVARLVRLHRHRVEVEVVLAHRRELCEANQEPVHAGDWPKVERQVAAEAGFRARSEGR
jgi:hypothetical protein